MNSSTLQGIYPAIVTPLHDNQEVATDVTARLLEHLLAAGVDGVYAAGSTGEGMFLDRKQRKILVDCLMEHLPEGKKLLVHVGCPTVEDAIDLAKHAAQAGAHAISSLPPHGSPRDVHKYYERLAAESPLPLILYYFPQACPWAFQNPGEIRELCSLPNIVAVKFTDYNLFLLQQLSSDGVPVMNGRDEVLAAGLLMGAVGGIGSTYNLAPDLYVDLYRASLQGNWEQARKIQQILNKLITVLVRYPFPASIKSALQSRGFSCGPVLNGQPFKSEAEQREFLVELDRVWPDPRYHNNNGRSSEVSR